MPTRCQPRLRAWIAALVVILAGVGSTHAQAESLSADRSTNVDETVTRFLTVVNAAAGNEGKAGLSLAIGTPTGLLYAKGYGEGAPGMPATERTVYHVGSLAKQFTAAAVLSLIGRKAHLRDGTPLDLDLALSRVFKGVEHWPGVDAGNGKQPVTLRSLLTMTSNLPNFTRLPPPSADPSGRIGAPQLLSELKKLNPSGWPNTFEYSNTSYFLLSEVMEEAVVPGNGHPRAHQDHLARTIFQRAALAQTGFVGDARLEFNAARPIHLSEPVFDKPDWLKGSADIVSSAADLYTWNRALMAGEVLPAKLRDLMFSDAARVTPSLYYGMGWFIEHRDGRDVYFHSGRVPGFTSYNMIAAAVAPDGKRTGGWISITFLINTDVADGLEVLADDLLRLASGK